MRQAPLSTQQDVLDWRLLKKNEATKTKFPAQELKYNNHYLDHYESGNL